MPTAIPSSGSSSVTASQITDAGAKGIELLQSADNSEAHTALGLGDAAVRSTGTGSTQVVLGNDVRLSNSRTPTSHTHAASDISDATVVGAALLTASDAADARATIGAAAAGAAPGPAAIYNAASGGSVGLQTSVSAGSWFFRFWGWVRDASGSAVANARGVVHIIADTATLSSSADAYSGTVLQYARPGSSGATYAAIAFETDAAGKFDLRTNYTGPGAAVKALVQIGNAVTTASGTVT